MSQSTPSAQKGSPDLQLVTITVAGQAWGIPIAAVREVLGPQLITPIPLAPQAVAGSLNLRGRIVTVLDLKMALGIGQTQEPTKATNAVIDHHGELYSLLIDSVGEAMAFPASALEQPPQTLDAAWKAMTFGIIKLDGRLLLALDLDRLLATAAGTNN